MGTDDWVRVPVGRDAGHWRTADTRRVVLGVVHTVASAEAVLDAVDLVAPDHRVQVVATQAPDVFSNGVREHLAAAGVVTVPWEQAVHTGFDLAVAADCGRVHELGAPVLALQHGVANNKLAPPALGGPASRLVVGLAAPWLTWYGRLVPAAVALSHHRAVEVLRGQCPPAVPIASVTGDLTLGRLTASAALRERYRCALAVPRGRSLIAVSWTWGADSLFAGTWRPLLDRLSDVPGRDFAVRIVVHPALWFGHGPRQVLAWSERPGAADWRMVEPTSWRGLVAAADVLIGDHGSATIYAAAAGVPVLRAGRRPAATAPGSAAELMARLTPAVQLDESFTGQLRAAAAAGRGRADGPMARAVSSRPPARAAAELRRVMYDLMKLAEPPWPCGPAPVPVPTMVRR